MAYVPVSRLKIKMPSGAALPLQPPQGGSALGPWVPLQTCSYCRSVHKDPCNCPNCGAPRTEDMKVTFYRLPKQQPDYY